MIGNETLPLNGIRVIEFVHMVMGPTCGLILADLGAVVIKIEPLEGDHTRKLVASGSGFFPSYNRNKKSLAIDLASTQAKEIVFKLIRTADVLSENFRPGAMEKLGFGYDDLKQDFPELIYCSHKGFLAGPYEDRTALDEVVQMMGGLAYMTGGHYGPIRAGASVNDVMGGMFGAIGVLAALYQRNGNAHGQKVKSALFENNVFLMAQHMMEAVMTGQAVNPMPDRVRAWAVYDIFDTADGEKIFVGVVTDTQWKVFCESFGLGDMVGDPSLATNPQRVAARNRIIPAVASIFRNLTLENALSRCEALGLPFARIARPEDLFDDPHLNAAGGMAQITLPNGTKTKVPILPLEMNGHRLSTRLGVPRVGEHTREVLAEIGYAKSAVDDLIARRVVVDPD